jgi:hypothetical protein
MSKIDSDWEVDPICSLRELFNPTEEEERREMRQSEQNRPQTPLARWGTNPLDLRQAMSSSKGSKTFLNTNNGVVMPPDEADTKPYWEWQQLKPQAKSEEGDKATGSMTTRATNLGDFAKLPGELRNRVYNFTLVDPRGVFDVCSVPGTCSEGRCIHTRMPLAFPGLLSTCRQIRKEGLPIFCQENRFNFDAEMVRYRCVAAWLRTLGEHFVGQIPGITLKIAVWNNYISMHDVTIECPPSRKDGKFSLSIDEEIRRMARPQTSKMILAIHTVNSLTGKESAAGFLLGFVWSEMVADLVYKCSIH